SPESEIGRKIALSDKVTFHEIGQLLETETVGAKTSVSEPPPAMVSDSGTDSTDISLNINESTITQRGTTLRNLTEASLNSRNTITRGEFAIIVEEMIIGITGDTYLKNRYKGASRSRFLDVPASHPAYSSICTTIEKKIMQLKEKQLFGPDKPLTGPDALLITKKLKNMGKM
ncbi:MAG: S-layer homology domain-containing protein, partial [Chitinispirillia bacterium]